MPQSTASQSARSIKCLTAFKLSLARALDGFARDAE
jgi:hypothetical protein